MTVDARLRENWDALEQPGDFTFYAAKDHDDVVVQDAGLLFLCPCGCGATLSATFTAKNHPRWSWDGNRERPTVTPSIRHLDGCRWHGFLTAGVFTGQNE